MHGGLDDFMMDVLLRSWARRVWGGNLMSEM